MQFDALFALALVLCIRHHHQRLPIGQPLGVAIARPVGQAMLAHRAFPERKTDQLAAHIQRRADAKAGKDFALADQIRKELLTQGVVLKDSPAGTTWEVAQ